MKNDNLLLTPILREICVGTMLGDATLQTQSQGKSWRIKFQMSVRHEDYAKMIIEYFGKEWIPSSPHLINRSNSKMLGFQTLTTSALCPIADLFFPNFLLSEQKKSKKIIPNLVENELSNLGLACWFMDDGSKGDWTSNQGKQIHLHTHCFTLSEVQRLCAGLKTKFGLEAKPKQNKNAYIILISGSSYELFLTLVEKYLVSSFYSKLPSPRKRK